MHPMHFPALIVGAGPAGLAAAIALGRRGVESLVVDRRPERSSLPRATTISTRSMELIRSWGLEDEVRAGGVEVEWLMWEFRRRSPAPPPACRSRSAFPPGHRPR